MDQIFNLTLAEVCSIEEGRAVKPNQVYDSLWSRPNTLWSMGSKTAEILKRQRQTETERKLSDVRWQRQIYFPGKREGFR